MRHISYGIVIEFIYTYFVRSAAELNSSVQRGGARAGCASQHRFHSPLERPDSATRRLAALASLSARLARCALGSLRAERIKMLALLAPLRLAKNVSPDGGTSYEFECGRFDFGHRCSADERVEKDLCTPDFPGVRNPCCRSFEI